MANNKFSDVVVRLTGSLPNVSIGLGIPLILVKTADTSDNFVPKLKKFYSIDEVNADYTTGTDVNTVAKTIFDQEARPDHVSVLEFKTLPNDLTTFWNEDWTFALLATPNASDAAALSTAVEQVGFKFAVVQVEKASDVAAVGGQLWTIVTVLPKANGRLDAAIVGAIGSLQVGSQNWKFKSVKDVTPYDDVTTVEYDAIDRANAITYVSRGGQPTTTSGHVANGQYIDEMHGRIWIKVNTEKALMGVLNKNDKVPYNAAGISLLQGELSNVLETAYQNGIIETGADTKGWYTVGASSRAAQTDDDILKRVYSGLTFSYMPSSSIDKVVVSGTVELP